MFRAIEDMLVESKCLFYATFVYVTCQKHDDNVAGNLNTTFGAKSRALNQWQLFIVAIHIVDFMCGGTCQICGTMISLILSKVSPLC